MFSGVTGNRMVAVEDFLQRVERAGADVAEDDADGGDGERRHGFTRVHENSPVFLCWPAHRPREEAPFPRATNG